MADFPLFGGIKTEEVGFDFTAMTGTEIDTGVTINTKGAYVELLSAANNTKDSFGVTVLIDKFTAITGNTYIDIAIGEAGSEQVIIENLFYFLFSVQTIQLYPFSIKIPKGVRISARSQGDVASMLPKVAVVLKKGNFKQGSALSGVKTLGAVTATTSGTLVTAGALGFGAWAEIEAVTDREFSGFTVANHRTVINSWSNGNTIYQVGVGAAGFEEVVSDGNTTSTTGAENGGNFASEFNNVAIPKGSRVAIRVAAPIVNADFDNDFIFYGAY